MSKYVAYGEITFINSTEPFSVILTNEAQQFVTDSSRKVNTDQSYTTDVIVYQGTEERTDFSLKVVTNCTQVTYTKSSNKITFKVSKDVIMPDDSGTCDITITLDGKSITKVFSWSCAKQGEDGAAGEAAKLVDITASTQIFKSIDGGITFSPDSITLTPRFQGNISYSKWRYSINGGSSWVDVDGKTHNITINTYKELKITKDSDLFTDSITSIVFRCISNNTSIYDSITIFKIYDVKDINVGGRNLLLGTKGEFTSTYNKSEYPNWKRSSEVVLEQGDKYTLSFFAKSTTGSDKIYLSFANSGQSQQYITETNLTIDAISYKHYKISGVVNLSSSKWDSVLFSNNNGWHNLSGNSGTVYIKQIKLEKGSVATDWTPAPEDVDSAIKEVTDTVSSVSLIVDENKKSIEGKVWQDDITKQLDDYDNVTGESMRSRISSVEQNIDGFKTEVSDEFTDFDKKITTAKTTAEQTSEKFSWIVQSGTSSSNFTLTDRAAQLVSDYINLNGLVTFKGLSSDVNKKFDRYDGWSADKDVTKIDGGMIYTHSITADQLSASSINAYKLQIGDLFNYVTVSEDDSSTMLSSDFKYGQTNILDGCICKQLKSSKYLILSNYYTKSELSNSRNINQGDEIFYEFTLKAREMGYFYPAYFGLDADYNIITICQGEYYTAELDFNTYKGKIIIDEDTSNDVYFMFGFYDDNKTTIRLYTKNNIFRKASGNVIIEDGSITAEKLAAKAVTAEKIDTSNLVVSQLDDDLNPTGINTLVIDERGNISLNVTSLKIISVDSDGFVNTDDVASKDDVESVVNSQVSALETKIENSEIWMNFGQLQQESSDTSETTTLWKKYIQITDGEMTFGRNTDDDGNVIPEKDRKTLSLSNERLSIKRGGVDKMVLDDENLYITSATITESLSIGGNYIIQPRQSGGIAFFKMEK